MAGALPGAAELDELEPESLLLDCFVALLLELPESLESSWLRASAAAAASACFSAARCLARSRLASALRWARSAAAALAAAIRAARSAAALRAASALALAIRTAIRCSTVRPLLGQLGVLLLVLATSLAACEAADCRCDSSAGDAACCCGRLRLQLPLRDQVRGRRLAVRRDLLLDRRLLGLGRGELRLQDLGPVDAWPRSVSNMVVDHWMRVCRSAVPVSVDQQRHRQQVGLLLVLVPDHLAGEAFSASSFFWLGLDRRLGLGQVAPAPPELGGHRGVDAPGRGELAPGLGQRGLSGGQLATRPHRPRRRPSSAPRWTRSSLLVLGDLLGLHLVALVAQVVRRGQRNHEARQVTARGQIRHGDHGSRTCRRMPDATAQSPIVIEDLCDDQPGSMTLNGAIDG